MVRVDVTRHDSTVGWRSTRLVLISQRAYDHTQNLLNDRTFAHNRFAHREGMCYASANYYLSMWQLRNAILQATQHYKAEASSGVT